MSKVKTEHKIDNREISYEIDERGYTIYLGGKPWISQHGENIPFPELSYENGLKKQIEQLVATQTEDNSNKPKTTKIYTSSYSGTATGTESKKGKGKVRITYLDKQKSVGASDRIVISRINIDEKEYTFSKTLGRDNASSNPDILCDSFEIYFNESIRFDIKCSSFNCTAFIQYELEE